MHLGTTPTLLSRAPLRLNGSFRYSPDDNQGGGDEGQKDQTKEGADKGKAHEPTKLTLTEAELQAKIEAALNADRQKAESKARKEREAAEAEEAKKRGEFEKLASTEKQRADALEARALNAERTVLVNDVFAKVVSANEGLSFDALNEWVRPKVLAALSADTSPEDVTKQAKTLAEKYAKENPPKAKGRAGAPGELPGRQPNRPSDRSGEGVNGSRQFTGAATRF